MSANPRVADYAIHPQFTDRWSPRAFTGEAIPEETLLSFFEAARWAPSAYNSQPWRFLYARRDTPNWERYLGLLNEFNRSWPGASEETPALWHTFDTGSAWGHLPFLVSVPVPPIALTSVTLFAPKSVTSAALFVTAPAPRVPSAFVPLPSWIVPTSIVVPPV